MVENSFAHSIFNSRKLNKLLLINYICLFLTIFGKTIIPFKYIPEKTQSMNTPKEIMIYYMKQKININLGIGTPKQEMQIPLGFMESDFYIVDNTHLREPSIEHKIFDSKKSSSFSIISEDIEYLYNEDYSMYQESTDICYFLKEYDEDEDEYNNIKMNFRFAYQSSTDDPGRFGLQIYSKDEDDQKVPCPLRILHEKKINDNYLWSIHYKKIENELYDEGYLLLGEYPHDLKKDIGFYSKDDFDKENFKTLFDISNSKTMNNEITMSNVFFYNKEGKKDTTNQNKFNDLQKEDLFFDIVIPQVTSSYVTKFDFNFGGLLIPEYFNNYIKQNAFDYYVREGKCYNENIFVGMTLNFYYCKKERSVINKIKDKIPTIIFVQEHLRYNFTMNINELIYEKNDYVFFLLFSSSSQKNKWILGKPFLKKYPLVFNPESKDIGFYSTFLLKGIKYTTVIVIAVVISVAFIIVGLLVGRKKYKQHKIQKQKALELSSDNSMYLSKYTSIELNSDSDKNRLYSE